MSMKPDGERTRAQNLSADAFEALVEVRVGDGPAQDPAISMRLCIRHAASCHRYGKLIAF